MGLDKAQALANAKGVAMELICADLAEFELGVNAWDAIVSSFCLPSARRCTAMVLATPKPA